MPCICEKQKESKVHHLSTVFFFFYCVNPEKAGLVAAASSPRWGSQGKKGRHPAGAAGCTHPWRDLHPPRPWIIVCPWDEKRHLFREAFARSVVRTLLVQELEEGKVGNIWLDGGRRYRQKYHVSAGEACRGKGRGLGGSSSRGYFLEVLETRSPRQGVSMVGFSRGASAVCVHLWLFLLEGLSFLLKTLSSTTGMSEWGWNIQIWWEDITRPITSYKSLLCPVRGPHHSCGVWSEAPKRKKKEREKRSLNGTGL